MAALDDAVIAQRLVSDELVDYGDDSPLPEPAADAEVSVASDAMPGALAVAVQPAVVAASNAIEEPAALAPTATLEPPAVAAPVAAVAGSKRKRRAAAERAVAAIGAEDEVVDEVTPKRVARTVAAPPSTDVEATLSQSLAGRFARFDPVTDPPDWLGAALAGNSPTAKDLLGAHICYRWESWGWCVARVGHTANLRCNFSAVYVNEWREDHTLTLEAYSTSGSHGSWALLQPTRSASPILGYGAGGKNKKVVNGATAWLRSNADGMLHHTKEEVEQARQDAAAAVAQEREEAVDKELDASAFEVGDRVWAKGRAPGSGEMEWFEAVVLGKRKRFPPLKVLYVKTADAQTDSLCLPTPQSSHVTAAHVRTARPE